MDLFQNMNVDTQLWLVTIISAMIGGLIGGYVTNRLTNKLLKRRAESLTNAFYNELEINKKHFIDWLKDLLNEYRSPKRKDITLFSNIDMTIIDSIIIELIVSGKVLTQDQRSLMLNLKNKFKHIKKISIERGEKSDPNKDEFLYADKYHTGDLILEAAETLFYLNEIIRYRDNFNIQKCSKWHSAPLHFFTMLDVDITEREWDTIKKKRNSSW